MGARRYPLIIREQLISTGDAYDELGFGRIDPGYRWIIKRQAFENKTSACTLARGYIRGHGYDHPLWEEKTPAAATLYWDYDELELEEGEEFVIRLTGCSSGDALRAYIDGYKVKLGEE